jgi:hypothetical protein
MCPTYTVTVTSIAPTRPTDPLPSSRHGLLGLHQRAALLGGTLTWAATPDGGGRTRSRCPSDAPCGFPDPACGYFRRTHHGGQG